jgi:two-component system, LytTR family, sensor kinase
MQLRIMRRWVVSFAAWTVVVLLFAGQFYTYDAVHSVVGPPSLYLRWSMQEWYPWAVLAPVVWWLARRYPFESGRRARVLLIHLGASLVIAIVSLFGDAIMDHLIDPTGGSIGANVLHLLSKHTAISILTYWILVTIAQLWRRAMRASQLETQLARARLAALRMQLHPHFLFNTLYAIGTLIHEDPTAAEEMVVRLGALLRASLADGESQEIPLARELEFLRWYLGIEQTRFQERLTVEIAIDDDALDCAVPSLVLQPLVENAIRHGIGRHAGVDTIVITGARDNGMLRLEVRNTNSVLEPAAEDAARRGVGLSNTRERLSSLYGAAAALNLRRLDPRGVAATIVLPARPVGRAHFTDVAAVS